MTTTILSSKDAEFEVMADEIYFEAKKSINIYDSDWSYKVQTSSGKNQEPIMSKHTDDLLNQLMSLRGNFVGDGHKAIQVSSIIKELERLTAENAELRKQQPVAVVDANADGYWADILPDRNVKVGDKLYTAPVIPADMVLVPKSETEEMQDAVRGILQIIRVKYNCTEKDVFNHCKLRGDSAELLELLHENSTAYISEARAASLIYRAMLAVVGTEKEEGSISNDALGAEPPGKD